MQEDQEDVLKSRKSRSNYLSRRGADQRGVSLVDTVISLALFFAIGGTFVYASIVIEDARKTSLYQTKSTISQSGVSNSFRSDVNKAKAVKVSDTGKRLTIAKADGSCALWAIEAAAPVSSGSNPVVPTDKLMRATSQDAPPSLIGASELLSDIERGEGSMSATGGKVALSLEFVSGDKLNEKISLDLAGSNGGECW